MRRYLTQFSIRALKHKHSQHVPLSLSTNKSDYTHCNLYKPK